jgi:hypothetical protein
MSDEFRRFMNVADDLRTDAERLDLYARRDAPSAAAKRRAVNAADDLYSAAALVARVAESFSRDARSTDLDETS